MAMKLHPAEVASELKSFSFFSHFPQDLLLQVSTLFDVKDFTKGEFLIKQGEQNRCLYFLRNGSVDIIFEDEKIASLQNKGDVIGEMSMISNRLPSSSVKASSEVSCLMISAESLTFFPPKDLDRLQYLLYRVYSHVLLERLSRANEKTKLLEVANRQIHEAQVALEKMGPRKILISQGEKKFSNLMRLSLASAGIEVETAGDAPSSLEKISLDQFDCVIADHNLIVPIGETLNPKIPLALVTGKEFSTYVEHFASMRKADYLFTCDPESRNFSIQTTLTSVQKILNKDPFGPRKYLTPGADWQSAKITSSKQRAPVREQIGEHFKKLGLRQTILERIDLATEEMLMNAIYDAPVDANGKALFNHMGRTQEVILEAHQQTEITYACDGVVAAVSVVDPFGTLTKGILFDYLESCYKGVLDPSFHQGKGGAGKGLHQIVESADLTVFNVKKNKKTEVIVIFFIEFKRKEISPALHYFFIE